MYNKQDPGFSFVNLVLYSVFGVCFLCLHVPSIFSLSVPFLALVYQCYYLFSCVDSIEPKAHVQIWTALKVWRWLMNFNYSSPKLSMNP